MLDYNNTETLSDHCKHSRHHGGSFESQTFGHCAKIQQSQLCVCSTTKGQPQGEIQVNECRLKPQYTTAHAHWCGILVVSFEVWCLVVVVVVSHTTLVGMTLILVSFFYSFSY